MIIVTGNAGAKSRFLDLLYLACIVLSLAPSVVGPPERNFTQGQPELQQAMDNMVIRNPLMKRTPRVPTAVDKDIPSLFTDRTTHLLEEAEHMLTTTKNAKEKEWMEGFVHKLQQIASVIEQNIANQTSENDHDNVAQSLNSSAVPAEHPPPQSLSEVIRSRAVPEFGPNKQQFDVMTSKRLVTLPEIDQVKPVSDYATKRQVVTKPGLDTIDTPEEDDELVRELESLHKLSSHDQFQQSVEAPETSSISAEIAKPASGGDEVEEKNETIEMEQKKEKVKERLASEVAELRRLGESEAEIVNALRIDGFKLVDSKNLQKENGREVNGFEEKNEILTDHHSVKRVLSEKSMLSKVDPNYWNLPALHAAEPPRQIYMNNTFLGMHINLPPMNPRVLRRQFHYGLHRNPMVRSFPFYHGGIGDTIQKLQTQNHQNIMMRNHMFATAAHQQGRPGNLRPVGVNPQSNYQSHNKYPPDNPAMNQYPALNGNAVYMPYPLHQNWEYKNDSPDKNQSMMTTYSTRSLPNHAEFSDEMKRQLRDGKVILLSDSVVRSNFTSELEKGGKTKA